MNEDERSDIEEMEKLFRKRWDTLEGHYIHLREVYPNDETKWMPTFKKLQKRYEMMQIGTPLVISQKFFDEITKRFMEL